MMKDMETKVFAATEEEDMLNFFKEQGVTDIWHRVFIDELTVKPLENNPIMLVSLQKELGLEDISDESILETMKDKKLCVEFPLKKMTTRPIRYTAFDTLCQRAGLTGSALSCYDNKSRQKEMSPVNKAMVLNFGLECFHGSKALILLRDEKISAVLSGDEADYSILPVFKLVEALKSGLKKEFKGISFSHAETNHEISYLVYNLNDKSIQDKYIKELLKYKLILSEDVNATVQFCSSDIGASGANIYPMLTTNSGRDIMIGEPLKLTHKNNHNVADFENNVTQIMSLFQLSAEKLASLGKIPISNPCGCFKAIAKKLSLPKPESIQAADLFDLCRPINCTAHDLYWALWEIIFLFENNVVKSGKVNKPSKHIYLQEQICRVINMDIKEYDHTFEWE